MTVDPAADAEQITSLRDHLLELLEASGQGDHSDEDWADLLSRLLLYAAIERYSRTFGAHYASGWLRAAAEGLDSANGTRH